MLKEKLEQLFSSIPDIDPESNALKTWHQLGSINCN